MKKLIPLISLLCLAPACLDGFYLQNGRCERKCFRFLFPLECEGSCLTCDNGNSCLTCSTESAYLDSGTRLCEHCGVNEYAQGESCQACGGGCSCSYQQDCFTCADFYDLESESCVSACEGVIISKNGLGFCRAKENTDSYQYFIDPLSSSPLEFGTRDHPFKSLNLASMEILNEISFTESRVFIYLKENTRLDIS